MDKSSLLYWFPKVKDLGIPIPRTKIVPLTQEEIKSYRECGGDTIRFPRLNQQVRQVIEQNFSLPVFIRTDEYSGKHSWNKTCFLDDLNNLERNLANLLGDSMTVNFLGPLPLQAIVVRQFIKMDTRFNAFSGNMPVNPERRYFVRDKVIECHHPYWIEDAVKKGTQESMLPKNWRKIVGELNCETEKEVRLLTSYSSRVAKIVPGYWSIDFCKAKYRTWYLIDMAEGEKSWHPSSCKYSTMPTETKQKESDLIFIKKRTN